MDNGFTTKCKYDYVISLAKNATAKAGGNGFSIKEHAKPSFWGSSCHQIRGAMLHISNPTIYCTKEDSFVVVNRDFATEVKKERSMNHKAQHCVSVNGGYGFIMSDFYDTNNQNVSGDGGASFSINYNWTSRMGLGVGAQYSCTKASLSGANINLTYIAPSIVYKVIGNKWSFGCGLGIGCFRYKESGPNYSLLTSNLGMSTNISVDYMIGKNLGLGITTDYIIGKLPESMNSDKGNKNSYAGIKYLNILGGLKYYF